LHEVWDALFDRQERSASSGDGGPGLAVGDPVVLLHSLGILVRASRYLGALRPDPTLDEILSVLGVHGFTLAWGVLTSYHRLRARSRSTASETVRFAATWGTSRRGAVLEAVKDIAFRISSWDQIALDDREPWPRSLWFACCWLLASEDIGCLLPDTQEARRFRAELEVELIPSAETAKVSTSDASEKAILLADLSKFEAAVVQAFGRKGKSEPLDGPEIAKLTGYAYDYTRRKLAEMIQRGLLTPGPRGYTLKLPLP
jgi:hypothetical protein